MNFRLGPTTAITVRVAGQGYGWTAKWIPDHTGFGGSSRNEALSKLKDTIRTAINDPVIYYGDRDRDSMAYRIRGKTRRHIHEVILTYKNNGETPFEESFALPLLVG